MNSIHINVSEENSTGISIMDSGLTDNMQLAVPACNRQPGFQCWELPARTEGASLTTSENDKARTCLSLDRFLRHLSFPPACSSLEIRPGRRLA
jgi:hypothetical protein